MAGFEFSMWLNDGDYVDVGRVLRAIGEDLTLTSVWLVRDADCAADPGTAQQLYGISERGIEVSAAKLLDVTGPKVQLIDGEMLARLPEARHPWLLLQAVDSTLWVIESTDARVYNRLRESFVLTPTDGPSQLAT